MVRYRQKEEVIAVRVPGALKRELKEFDIDYAEEVRKLLSKRVRQRRLKKLLEKADKYRAELQKKVGITSNSADIIRWDREHGH